MLAGALVALPPPEKWVSTGIGFPLRSGLNVMWNERDVVSGSNTAKTIYLSVTYLQDIFSHWLSNYIW
jgi:hypothetical protein